MTAQPSPARPVGRLWAEVGDRRGPATGTSAAGRVAVCHEWLTTLGGADKVAALLSRHYEADLFAAFALRPELAEELDVRGRLVTSRLNEVAASGRNWQYLLPAMSTFWRSLDLEGHDVVLTSSHAAVNAVRTGPETRRICYCHTPMRYAWEWREERSRLPGPARPALRPAAAALRWADRRWSRSVDVYVANSRFVAERIRRAYGREAVVVHPPIDVHRWHPGAPAEGGYFLVAGRLVGYKQPMTAVLAARRAGAPVVVAGSGPVLAEVEALGDPGVTIVPSPDDDELRDLYQQARALVLPGVEDFGMTVLEAQACGTPVIARAAGGTLDSVLPGVTGVLVAGGEVEDFADAMRTFDRDRFDPAAIRDHAEGFSAERFLAQMDEVLAGQR